MSVFCAHYGSCGGCDFQEMSYASQLEYKTTYCRNLFAFSGCVPEPIVSSPRERFFRNKMELAVTGTSSNPIIGQRRKEHFDQVVDFAECPVFSEQLAQLLGTCRSWIQETGIEPYDLKKRTGELRYIGIRHSKAYNEFLLTVSCNLAADELFLQARYRGLYDQLVARVPVSSLFLACNTEASDNVFSSEPRLLTGRGYIRERINGVEYIIKPQTFFQTNPACCERLYAALREAAAGMDGRIYDMYCGSGGITIQLAGMARQVTGIDISQRNIDDAVQNCQMNGLTADFFCQDADVFLQGLSKNDDSWSMIVDPPRNGLTGRFLTILIASGPKEFIYVSCNPLKLHEDVKKLAQVYTVSRLIPVDMFPHTRHIEMVALLKRK
jgi:23S rRNA (uracil1939-C5)-methyltransferase